MILIIGFRLEADGHRLGCDERGEERKPSVAGGRLYSASHVKHSQE